MAKVKRGARARLAAADRRAESARTADADASDAPADGRAAPDWPVIVVLRFEDGPLTGRRMPAPASIGTLHFYGTSGDGRPVVATTADRGAPVGTYRRERAYDCEETMEHVVVLRWEPRAAPTPARPVRSPSRLP